MSKSLHIQDPTSGKSYQLSSEELERFATDNATEQAPGVVTLALPADDIIEELPATRRAMLQFGC